MARPDVFALSLGLSLVLSLATYGLMMLFERRQAAPALREQAWALALYLPVLPVIVAVGTLVLPPLSGSNPAMAIVQGASSLLDVEMIVPQGGVIGPWPDQLATAVLCLAGLFCLGRAARLLWRTIRLRRFILATRVAPTSVIEVVEGIARRTATPMPDVRIADQGSEAMIVGLRRPVLVLPVGLTSAPASKALMAVGAHELAHLRRGDHRTLWIEEALLTAMAFNPLLGLIRDRRAAAREEACDVEALRHSGEDVRRLYARLLIDALRVSSRGDLSPALSFTSSRRILVMRRLKAILSPAPVPGARHRLAMLGVGVTVTAIAGTASLALASQRGPDTPRVAVLHVQPVAMPTAPVLPTVRTAASTKESPKAPARVVAVATSRAETVVRPTPVETPALAPITNPAWVQSPRPSSWPQAATTMGVTSGSVAVSCTALADGRLADCVVVTEDPAGAGFGAAALEAAGRARLSPSTIDAGGAGRAIRFTVSFRLG